MNLDARIEELVSEASSHNWQSTDYDEIAQKHKQLIRDVLEEVKPEHPSDEDVERYESEAGYDNAITNMEAKIKELGL